MLGGRRQGKGNGGREKHTEKALPLRTLRAVYMKRRRQDGGRGAGERVCKRNLEKTLPIPDIFFTGKLGLREGH